MLKNTNWVVFLFISFIGNSCDDSRHRCISYTKNNIINGYDRFDTVNDIAESVIEVMLTNKIKGHEMESFCSGVAITRTAVLTAAHCFRGRETWRIEIRSIGMVDYTDEEGCLIRAWIPAEVSGLSQELDAAWLEISEPLLSPSTVGSPPEVGDDALIAGFGLNQDNVVGSLAFLNTRIISISPSAITVDSGPDAGACVGDSGGPLFYRPGEDGQYRLIGILREGSSGCKGKDVFENIVPIREWLSMTISF